MFRRSYLNESDPVKNTFNLIPHKDQLGKVQFVTFRLGDSLPQEKTSEIANATKLFKTKYPKPWDKPTHELYANLIGNKAEYWLDQGYGSCIMSHVGIRKIVADSLLFFNTERYYLHSFVLMPNHVHLLLSNFIDLDIIIKSIKQFSSRKIKNEYGIKAAIWMKSYFDRYVRTESSYAYYWNYIKSNPSRLLADRYTLWMDPDSLPEPIS
ncbi:MAG: transposase [Muribaculum sp.]|nr:transposase [Muribaculum sp.]